MRSGGFLILEPLPSCSEIMNQSQKATTPHSASGSLGRAPHPQRRFLPRELSPLKPECHGNPNLPRVGRSLVPGWRIVRVFVAKEKHPFLIPLLEKISAPQCDGPWPVGVNNVSVDHIESTPCFLVIVRIKLPRPSHQLQASKKPFLRTVTRGQ